MRPGPGPHHGQARAGLNRLLTRLRERPAATLLQGGVRTYQLTLRAVIGNQCRFHPHCSAYAMEALEQHGAARGSWLAARRILRCNPWHPGGYDPVPPADAASASSSRGPASPPGALPVMSEPSSPAPATAPSSPPALPASYQKA